MPRIDIPYLLNRTNLIGAEIGVESGIFSEELIETGLFKTFYAIDPWPEFINGVHLLDGSSLRMENKAETYNEALNRLLKYDECTILRDESKHASDRFLDESFDFVFIDGDHTYDGVLADLNHWWPKIKRGGILSGHDYIDRTMILGDIKSIIEVKSAVDYFADRNKLILNVEPDEFHDNWFIAKL